MSDNTSDLVDSETRQIVENAYARATEVLTTNLEQLHTLANALLDFELLSGDEIKDILAGKKIERPEEGDDTPVSSGPKSSVPKTSGIGGASGGGAPQGA